jgi:hypothetical protein
MKTVQNRIWSLLREHLSGVGLWSGTQPYQGTPRNHRPGLGLETLEDRLTPATFFYQNAFGDLSLMLDAGQDLSVQESAGTVTFTLSQGRWFSLGGDQPTSDVDQILTFDASHPLNGSLVITGGFGANNVTFLGGAIRANQVNVDLATGVASSGSIAFTTAPTSFTGLAALDFTAQDSITQSVPITTAAPAVFTTDTNVISLSNPANDFGGPVSVGSQGNHGVTLADANNLTVLAVDMDTGPLTIEAGGVVDFASSWHFQLNKGGPSFQVLIGAGATGIDLAGATLAGTATGFAPNDTVLLVSNQSSVPFTGTFTNGSSATLGNLGFMIGVNSGNANKDVVLTAQGTLNQIYVSNLYAVLLERPVDPTGLSSWSQELDQGASRQEVVSSIMSSSEYLTLEVTKLYQTLLGRQPDPAGLTSNVAFLQHGGTIRDLKSVFFGSAEYFQVRGNGTNDGWLTAVYQDVLGRAVDPGGGAGWTMELAQGVSRQAVATSIQLSPEATNRLVEGFYLQYLGRPADPSGLQSFASELSAGSSEESVISGMVTSDEFYKRSLIPTV